ncbi:iron ABC transporter permease [Mumia sp. zg.B17]|uniref:FecCD family ABC transporter permease n=1 Tax=Mumia sp. zg.B17 TaxID=2855446 RepID=UPI0027E2F32D|nr:iron ABC transporter permease [Mumia sp. zg.B17]
MLTPGSDVGRRTAVMLALVAATVAVAALSLAVGSRSIGIGEVLGALLGRMDSDNATVITSQRLPRTLLALVAGAALGVAGALMQGHTRNPLAEPGLFGVNAGATFGVAVLVFALGVQSSVATVVAALIGAGAVSTIVFLLGLGSLRRGAMVMLAVLGTTMAALLSALTAALILLDRQTLDVLRFWEVGAVSNRDLELAGPLVVVVCAGFVLATANAFSLNALTLGEDVAQALGTRVRRSRVVGIVAVTLLAGAATAVCGPLAFVGLVAPHAARFLSGHDYRWLVPYAGLVGAVVLTAADTVGRVAAPPGELQAGVVVVLVGAPLLIAITRRRRLVAL